MHALAQILGADPRIGPAFLRAGLGFGGGCLPKDVRAFAARAGELGAGAAVGFLREVDAINLRCRARTADLALELAGGDLAGVPVCVLGAAFKPGSDDVRDSPALDVAQVLTGMGARVTVYDPAALGNARRARPGLGYAPTLAEAAWGAHVVLLQRISAPGAAVAQAVPGTRHWRGLYSRGGTARLICAVLFRCRGPCSLDCGGR